MSNKEILLRQIERLPEPLLKEVLEFIRSLQANMIKESIETFAMSESLLSRDWQKPEEDEAWQNL